MQAEPHEVVPRTQCEDACEKFNRARNDGKMTRGLTPAKAWEHFQSSPLVRLPKEARYLLAHHKRPVTVSRNGITLRFGRESFVYRSAETGRLRGQRVLAWFNPELPELLPVTDMNRENCFSVERTQELPAMDAAPELIEAELGRVEAHNAYARNRYRVLVSKINVPIRPTIMDRPTAELGRAMEEQATASKRKRDVRKNQATKARRGLTKLGFTARAGEVFTDDQLKGIETLNKLFSKDGKHE